MYAKILSPNTDVFVLSIHLLASLQDRQGVQLDFELSGKKQRILSVNKFVENLGYEKSKAMLGFHVFSRCDQIGKMSSVTKKRAISLFLSLESGSPSI